MKQLIYIFTIISLFACKKETSQNHSIKLKDQNLELLVYLPSNFDTTFTYTKSSDDGCDVNVTRIANKKYNPVPDSTYLKVKFPDSTFQLTITYLDTGKFNQCSSDHSTLPQIIESIIDKEKAFVKGPINKVELKSQNKNIQKLQTYSFIRQKDNLKDHNSFYVFNLPKSRCYLKFNHHGTQTKQFIEYSNKILESLELKQLVTHR